MARDTKRIFQTDDDLAKEMAAYWKEMDADSYRLAHEIKSLKAKTKKLKENLDIGSPGTHERYDEYERALGRLNQMEKEYTQAKQKRDWVENWANGQRDASGNQVGGLRQHFGWDKFKTYTEAKEQIPEDLLPLYENL